MNRLLNNFIPAQALDEQEQASFAKTLQTIVWVALVGAVFSFLAALYSGTLGALIIMAGLFILLAISLYSLRRGILLPAQLLTPTALFATITYLIITGNGLHDAAFIAYAGVIITASLTLGQGASFFFAGIIVITSWLIGIAEINETLNSPGSGLTDPSTPVFITILVLAITFTQRTLLNRLNENLRRARLNEQKQIEANKELLELQSNLEARVAERTAELTRRSLELENANRQNERRAAQFEALTQVTRTVISIRDLQQLLPRITSVISEKYGFYHIGIFLLDDINSYAILSAANSAGGQKMLARKHRLKIGEEGIVGYAAATGKPRIALDVGNDAVFFNNPDLPETHSEVSLPLISKNIIVGVLDVQSTEVAAFSGDDIQSLSLLADQVSLAIENARLFDDTRKALAESETANRNSIREAWARLPEQQQLLGFRYDISGATPLREPVNVAEKSKAEENSEGVDSNQIVVPIGLRGEVIGNLIVQAPHQTKLEGDQFDLIKAVADRVALSAENARLFEETTARAERERKVSDITNKIRQQNDPQAMIQIAIEELRNALGATRVEVTPRSSTGSNDKKAGNS